MTQHFDVAVVGMQTTGIITAALLAKRGRRVLLVDHGENLQTYKHKGITLPIAPILIPSFESSPHIQDVHEELALGPDLRALTRPLEPLFQAVLPRHRIDIRSRHDALLDELRLEFPQLVEPVRQFFSRLFAMDDQLSTLLKNAPPLPPHGWFRRLRWHSKIARLGHFNSPFESNELLAGIPADHPIREILLGPLTFFGYLTSDKPSTFHAVRLIARYFRGMVRFDDQVAGLGRLLLQAAERSGVVVLNNAMVEKITRNGTKLTELTISNDRVSYSADYFISNTFGEFHSLLPTDKLQERYISDYAGIRQTGSLLVLNLVVKKEVIPLGMAHTFFLLNGRRQQREADPIDPPLFVQRHTAQKGEIVTPRGRVPVEDDNHEVLSIACPVELRDVQDSPDTVKKLSAQMLARLKRTIPFIEEFLSDATVAADTSTWDALAENTLPFPNPWLLHPIFATANSVLGVGGRPVTTAYKNLFHCGRDVLPGLGLEGEYIVALNTANELQLSAGRAWRTGGK